MQRDNRSVINAQEASTSRAVNGSATEHDLSTEQILERMAREGGLPADLEPLWNDIKARRARTLEIALNEAEKTLQREIILGEAERVACVLWIAHTYVYNLFKMTPRLFITSGSPSSGKTTLLTMVADMCSGGRRYNKVTVAALGRLKNKYGSKLTLALDQLDNALDLGASETGAMLDRLISGADRNSKQVLTEKNADGRFEPVEYDLFYPMALTKIGSLPSPALRSRCIVIQMHPATAPEAAELTNVAIGHADENIRPLLAKALQDVVPDLAAEKPLIPNKLINRGADKWRPLLAIAGAAAGDWPERARSAATMLENEPEEQLPQISLLCDVMTVIQDWPHSIIFSEELDGELSRLGGSSRSDRQITSKERGHLLRSVGLKAERHWRDGKQLRGYRISNIRDAAAKYLRPDTCDG
jgi:Protein of unknown function (DUF3631)